MNNIDIDTDVNFDLMLNLITENFKIKSQLNNMIKNNKIIIEKTMIRPYPRFTTRPKIYGIIKKKFYVKLIKNNNNNNDKTTKQNDNKNYNTTYPNYLDIYKAEQHNVYNCNIM